MQVASSGYASGAFPLLQPTPNLVIIYKLAAVGGGDAFIDDCEKHVALTQHRQSGIRQALLDGLSSVSGYLGELCFLFGRKV
jgi:hypothetical protein